MGTTDNYVSAAVQWIVGQMDGSELQAQLLKAAQEEVSKGKLKVTDLKRGIIQGLRQSGWDKKLRNAVYQYLQKCRHLPHPLAPPEHQKEPCGYIRRAQANWEKRILKSLNSMCTELSITLARKRPEKEQKDLASRWSELGTDIPDLSSFRPVYAPKDFLEVIAGLKHPNLSSGSESISFATRWGVVQVPLKVKTIHELRLEYSEMAINQSQSGIDDNPELPNDLFENDRLRLARKVLAAAHSPLAQEFSKKGCPKACRAQLWSQILAVDLSDIDTLYYEQLKHCVLQHDLLVDTLVYKDVKLTATNDDQYFVFEDYLYQVLLPFARDTNVLQVFQSCSATPPKSYIRGKLGIEEFAVTYPPNGVIPFHGFSMYVAPLCFVYDKPVDLYYIFRELYMRYFYKLHTLSSDEQGIIGISLLFEELLQTNEPQLFYHLKSCGCQPLRIAFKWLVRAFSGYLASEQVLLLWDRILAYNSLDILAVLAMAIFSFRKQNLMQVQSVAAAEAVVADLTTLNVIPLIQLCLFSK